MSQPPGAITPESFGARGDGQADDTKALQAAFDAAPANSTVWLSGTYRHSDVLRFRATGATLDGGGTLIASREWRSAVWIDADRVTVRHLTLKLDQDGPRRYAYEQMKLRASHRSGLVLENLKIEAAGAAGVFLEDVSDFTARNIAISKTRADGFHMTGGSTRGRLTDIRVDSSGDDGVAVVSYQSDPKPCSDITVTDSVVTNQVWGRGFSVVGGDRVTFERITALRTSGAGLYVASEAWPYYTRPTTNVTATSVNISEGNQNTAVAHGAVLVYSANTDHPVGSVQIKDLHVHRTSAQSGRVVGILGAQSAVSAVSVDTQDLNPAPGMDPVRRLFS